MTSLVFSSFLPKAKLQFDLSNAQDWRDSEKDNVSPVFLASQNVYGCVDVKYRDAACTRKDDRLQIKLVGK